MPVLCKWRAILVDELGGVSVSYLFVACDPDSEAWGYKCSSNCMLNYLILGDCGGVTLKLKV